MIFYSYFRSSAAYRVRIALNLKGVQPETRYVNLKDGAQRQPDYVAVNPAGMVPALVLPDGQVLSQSMAIIEYLEEAYPSPALLPGTPEARAQVRAMAQTIACDVHPLNNLRVLNYLTGPLGQDEDEKNKWMRHWMLLGFEALEGMLGKPRPKGMFCWGNQPSMADICLVPQLYNARRFAIDLSPFPTLTAIEAACLANPAFDAARPEAQADCPTELRA